MTMLQFRALSTLGS